MDGSLEFGWDDDKARRNLSKHHVSSEPAMAVFLDPEHTTVDASRSADQEERAKVIGRIDGILFTVVFTWRGDRLRPEDE